MKNPAAVALGALGGSAGTEAQNAARRRNSLRPRPNARGKKKPRKNKSAPSLDNS